MILLLTNREDITSDYIIAKLKERGEPFVRLNTEDFPRVFRYSHHFGEGGPDRQEFSGRFGRILEGSVRGVLYRRPGRPAVPDDVEDSGLREYCEREWLAAINSMVACLRCGWLNHPSAIGRAEVKPWQLRMAVEHGLSIPPTVVTNDVSVAHDFVKRHGRVVGKPLRSGLVSLDGRDHVIFTTRIEQTAEVNWAGIEFTPIILQQEIQKRVDIRVTVVDDRIFAVAIHSQTSAEAAVDWRRAKRLDLEHEVHDLPNDIKDKCARLVRECGLRFGAIDLVLDKDGRYVFLELNPNGQWAWIEERTGLPIADAIVGALSLQS